MDTKVPGFGVRIMGKPGAPVRSFILVKRFPGSDHPTRRTLGTYGELTLEQARDKAKEWLSMIGRGVDPALEEERQRQAAIEAEKRRQKHTFEAALEVYVKRKAKLRTIHVIERELRRECAEWLRLPI